MILKNNDPYKNSSFTLKNRLLRALWGFSCLIFFRISPRPFHGWRVFVLRVFGAQIGLGCHVYPSVKIWAPWNLKVGNHSGIGDRVNLYNMDKIEIGDFVAISQGSLLCGGTHDYNSPNFQLVIKPIVIKTHAWICAEVFLHPGVVIPEGAVVGARAVVTKSLPISWAVYTGNPCKQVALRKKTTWYMDGCKSEILIN